MKKLAIVGSGPQTRANAPFEDSSWDIWVFNEAANSPWCKRWDAVFQMHKPELYQGHNTKDPGHWNWLQQKHGKPIYMQEVDPLVPDSVRFPLENAFALNGERYLTATVCMAVALGLLQGYEHIGVWGVELSVSEYRYQAECLRYWIGFAKGKLGAENVVLHQLTHFNNPLLAGPLYGYEGAFAFGKEYFEARAIELDALWTSSERKLRRQRDKLEKAVRGMKFEKVPDLFKELTNIALATGELSGALAEAERYAAFGDRYADRGGFEFAGAKAQRESEERKAMMFQAIGVGEYIWNAWRQLGTNQATIQLVQQLKTADQSAYDAGAYVGMFRENMSYINKYDAMVQANGAPVQNGVPA